MCIQRVVDRLERVPQQDINSVSDCAVTEVAGQKFSEELGCFMVELQDGQCHRLTLEPMSAWLSDGHLPALCDQLRRS